MRRSVLTWAGVITLIFMALPALAQITIGSPGTPYADEDFGKYLADHQDELGPFFTKNAGELFRLGVPLAMSMMGGVIIFTMLLGWGLDVLLARGFAFFCAPAYGDWKRCVVYATGSLFLTFLYTCLMGLAIVLSLGLSHALLIIGIVLLVLGLVAFFAQIVWILYLYRTSFSISIVFCLVVGVAHVVAGFLLMQPMMGSHAPSMATNFIDRAITPRLQAEADTTNAQLAKVKSSRDGVKRKVAELQSQVEQSQAEQERLRQKIEEKKNSDIYILAQIVKLRAAGDLAAAREQLAGFSTRFPGSSLENLSRAQLSEVNEQIAADAASKKQQAADQARADAAARADLLARAAKGQVTLSEMRQALIGKSRAQVSELLGAPPQTASDTWGYTQQMIENPLTNEHTGLKVYFNVGIVQGVDYNRSAP